MRIIGGSVNRSKVVLLLAVAAISMILVAMLQQRTPSWSGRIHWDKSSQSIPIGRFRSVEQCRLSGTADLKQRGWKEGETVCSNDQVKPTAPEGARRRFKISDGVVTEVTPAGS